jgi:predicted nucleic-acid-binding protein
VTGIDTNILVRYFTQDDPVQSRRATRFLQEQCSSENPCLINRIVLCELVWVLIRAYAYSKPQVIEVLEKVLLSEFVIEDHAAAWTALRLYKRAEADFADCLVGILNLRLGCDRTRTFDRAASRLRGFALLSD